MNCEVKPITIRTLENGLTVIVEEMRDVESVAYELCIPGGVVCDPEDALGSSLVLSELISRGAAGRDSHALSDAFDDHGIRHSESASLDRFYLRGMLLGNKLTQAIELLRDVVLDPRLPEEDLAGIQSILLQDLASLHDNPARWAFTALAERYYPPPYNRSVMGSEAGIKACGGSLQRAQWRQRFAAGGSILSIAGKCRSSEVLELIERMFSVWGGRAETRPPFGDVVLGQGFHVTTDSAQLQIALQFPSARFGDPLYYPAKVAAGILSGGMFGRLFTEVREKRGLVYSVYARHTGTRDFGTVSAYAGTTPEKAEETLEVMLRELSSVAERISGEELQRAKANLKAGLVIGEEAPASRASSNGNDYWLDGRIRSLEEVVNLVNAVSGADIEAYASTFSPKDYTLLTLGPKELIRS